MREEPFNQVTVASFLSSLCALFFVFLVLAGSVFPTIVNNGLIEGNFIKNGRYGITNPALESIGQEEDASIIGIGSSILEYAMDGQCIGTMLEQSNIKVYNLAISGGNPYTEMLQVPAIIAANPQTVMVDVGPNSLWNFYESQELDDYIEFRFTILSITLALGEENGWFPLLREKDRPFVATSLQERLELTTSYSQISIENMLAADLHEWLDTPYYDRGMPEVGGGEWLDYLQTPKYLPPHFEAMNRTEVVVWFEENMEQKARYGVYNPLPNGTLNHEALEYTIRSLTQSGIEVIMVATPHHPMVYEFLAPGQIDGHNATLAYFENTYGAKSINWFWETWDEQMFRDRNHLGDLGREYFCERIGNELNKI